MLRRSIHRLRFVNQLKSCKYEGKEGALELYEKQRREGVPPSVFILVAALKECISSKDLKRGMRIHSDILAQPNDPPNIFVHSTLVDMYAKLGSMAQARRVFNAMPYHNVVTWTVLIWGYVQTGDFHQALQLFSCMQEKNISPNARTYVAALKACTGLAAKEDGTYIDGKLVKVVALEKGSDVHSRLVEKSFELDAFVSSALVDMYAKCGSMKEAQKVFDKMPKHDVISWTAIILGYSHSGEGERALELFSSMQDEGFVPDARTFLAALHACTCLASKDEQDRSLKTDCLAKGRRIHSDLGKHGYESDIYVASALVDMYSKCGSMIEAREVFNRMKQRNLVTWTSIILGYVTNGDAEMALELFSRMQLEEGLKPNARAYVAVLKACASMAATEEDGRLKEVALEKGREIHRELSKEQHDLDVFVGNTLVDMYSKCGSLDEARQAFDKITTRTVVSWNALIMGYVQAGDGEQALELFSCMKTQGFVPDALAYVAALKACSCLVALETGRKIHKEVREAGLEKDLLVANSLISFYGKSGSLLEAGEVFDSVPRKDLISWSALIAGYSYQGDTKQACDIFDRMQNEERLHPDGVTFLSILTACSHAGLVDKGKSYFQLMCSDYMITPSIEHYTVMIDLLGRASHVEEALFMLRTMPYEPNSTVWMTVLGACRKWKNVTVGKQAFESLVKLDERDAPAYVLMADTYAAAGMWEESAKVNVMRRKARAWKKQGQSWWVDKHGAVHRFGVGDRKHPQTGTILAKLKDMLVKMKEAGYEPDLESVVYNISDEEKETALCGHSEKLAIGCALINSPPGTEVRIAKNLRVCGDCHKATEIISKLERRVIICRDATRFHVFEEGKCSCGGFW